MGRRKIMLGGIFLSLFLAWAAGKGEGFGTFQAYGNTAVTTYAKPGLPSLPPAYDYRKAGRAPAVKDQGSLGTCWAFASLMALESSLLPKERLEFSQDHMSLDNGFCLGQDQGGEYTMSMAYLLSWKGPVLESQDPYGDGYSPKGLKPAKHVQEIQILPPKDYQGIKRAIYQKGGVQSSIYLSLAGPESRSMYYGQETSAYYYPKKAKPNHDVVIVGWDDDYPKGNFNQKPPGDGAFICANSWGKGFGDGGYFYVSYYDAQIGKQNILYSSVQPSDNYGHIYQSDLRGWVGQLGYGRSSAYFANVYQAAGRERLEAVGFYATRPDTEYQVFAMGKVAKSQDLSLGKPLAEGRFAYGGFYTVPLDQGMDLDPGERFGVMVRITTPGAVHPVAIEYDAKDGRTHVDISHGEGYISNDGKVWDRVEEKSNANVCLKAYTVDR